MQYCTAVKSKVFKGAELEKECALCGFDRFQEKYIQ